MTDHRNALRIELLLLVLFLAVVLAVALTPRATPAQDDPTTPVVSAAARYDVAVETLRVRTRTLAACQSALHISLVEQERGNRIRALAGTLLFAKGEEDAARREVAEAERVLATALLVAAR